MTQKDLQARLQTVINHTLDEHESDQGVLMALRSVRELRNDISREGITKDE